MKESSVLQLFAIDAIKLGNFQLKTGIYSPIYIDLRSCISFPKLLKELALEIMEKIFDCSFDLICGVPYTALPIATAISIEKNVPMVLRRKEAKNYGTKKMIEGKFEPGQRCLIIEDVVTSGTSIFETASLLRDEGLIVEYACTIIDREQGGSGFLAAKKIELYSLTTLRKILNKLHNSEKIDEDTVSSVHQFLDSLGKGIASCK